MNDGLSEWMDGRMTGDLLRFGDWCLQWKLWNLGLLLLDGMEPNDATAALSPIFPLSSDSSSLF